MEGSEQVDVTVASSGPVWGGLGARIAWPPAPIDFPCKVALCKKNRAPACVFWTCLCVHFMANKADVRYHCSVQYWLNVYR